MERLLHILALVLVAVFLPPSNAQQLQDGNSGNAVPIWGLSAEIHGGQSPLCNRTFADANVTALYSVNPNVEQGPQAGQTANYDGMTLDSGMAITIYNPGFEDTTSNTSAAYSLWYSPNGANYSNDYALGYDVCALAGYSFNYNTQLRGQSDNGSCLTALDQPCVNAVEALVEQYAAWLSTPSPGPNSNLTNTSLPGVCHSLSAMLAANMPTECSYFFQEKLDGLAWPLTSYGANFQTGLYSDCTINGTYQNALTFFNNASEAIYDAWTESVTPLVFVWMPVTDAKAQTVITTTVAKMFCGHANMFNKGSDKPPAAPTPTPVKYNTTSNASSGSNNSGNKSRSSSLSAGAIAGIVVGIVLALALIALLALFLRRRKRRPNSTTTGRDSDILVEKPDDARHEMNGDSTRAQLAATEEEGGREKREMLDSTQLQEMDGEDKLNRLKQDTPAVYVAPVELPAHELRRGEME